MVALKWAVREMEERYKQMSKLGVRNIDGYNARVAEARAKGETLTRTVQTGYDKETGEAIYEKEELDLEPLPYIVVIVDEMADLMMVAGKDIEGAVQRLAQMARAAGIHVILATQRPSVDVITGTIKANFPTRISFQVTSKIDSRTILGEQGAEQLLGQGDMLYMAGGGRISRVHGPFVSDEEVEKVVRHLKTQGTPQYLEAVTAAEERGRGRRSDLRRHRHGARPATPPTSTSRPCRSCMRDSKASTSYIQRRLQIGYNRAASLMERMEKEGIVGQANHAGKREILVAEERRALLIPRPLPDGAPDTSRFRRISACVPGREIATAGGYASHGAAAGSAERRMAQVGGAEGAANLASRSAAREFLGRAGSGEGPDAGVPLPPPRPNATGALAGPTAKPAPPPIPPPPREQAQVPISNPSAALFGKPGDTTAFDAKQRALADRVSAYLSSVRTLSGNFVQVGPDGSKSDGRILPAKARPHSLRLQSAEPDRADRRRQLGGGSRPQARHPGPLPAVADAAALPARRPYRSAARHQSGRRLCR